MRPGRLVSLAIYLNHKGNEFSRAGVLPAQLTVNFMIIKFSDKFESLFYAVLTNNLTGYFLVAKNNDLGLFSDEEFIDIEKINWQQILEEHNNRFGEIKWLDYSNPKFYTFKQKIDANLQKNSARKYSQSINAIKQALKFGLISENGIKVPISPVEIENKINLFPKLDNQLI